MKFVCPNCQKAIFNRRVNKCEFCASELPTELLYSENDLERLDKKKAGFRRGTSSSSSSTACSKQELLDFGSNDSGGFE